MNLVSIQGTYGMDDYKGQRVSAITGSKFFNQTKGTATVEFAIVAGLLFLVVIGIMDFGHAWYMNQTIANASREGARYAVIYQVDANTGIRRPPSNFNPSVTSVVDSYLTGILLAGSWNVTPSGPGFTSGVAGAEVVVTVTTDKTWFAIHNLVTLFGGSMDPKVTLTARTSMRVE